ncbi:hypothetical protein HDU83_005283 [Entophlyctis luteolus]|nr:hypothetical protein HDU83_005283 [Entophlyctis luteolus]
MSVVHPAPLTAALSAARGRDCPLPGLIPGSRAQSPSPSRIKARARAHTLARSLHARDTNRHVCVLQVRLPPSLARSRTAPIPIPALAPDFNVPPPVPALPSTPPRPRSPMLFSTSVPSVPLLPSTSSSSPSSPLRPRRSLPPGTLKSALSATIASSAPIKPATPVLAFDADTAKSHVNERAARKIMDLEIANESLLAVNTTLENTIREQALNLEQMRRIMGVLKRKYGEASLSVDYSDDSASNSETFVESVSLSSSKSGLFVRQKFDPFANAVIEEIDNSLELQKEVEQQFDRVCDTISQLIEAGEKALKTTFKAKPPVPDVNTMPAPASNTLSAPLESHHHQVPEASASSPANISPPRTILSSSPTKSKPIVALSKLTPMTSDILAMGSTGQDTRALTPPPPSSSPEAMDVMYEKARMLIAARRAYARRQAPSTERNLAALDAQISGTETVTVPAPLFAAFVEVVDGVHDDLAESREYLQRLQLQQKAQATGKPIVAGNFAITVGAAGSALIVGADGVATGSRLKEFGAIIVPSTTAPASKSVATGGSGIDAVAQRRKTAPPPMTRRANSARPGSPLQRNSTPASPGPALGSRVFSTQRRSVQNLRRDL